MKKCFHQHTSNQILGLTLAQSKIAYQDPKGTYFCFWFSLILEVIYLKNKARSKTKNMSILEKQKLLEYKLKQNFVFETHPTGWKKAKANKKPEKRIRKIKKL